MIVHTELMYEPMYEQPVRAKTRSYEFFVPKATHLHIKTQYRTSTRTLVLQKKKKKEKKPEHFSTQELADAAERESRDGTGLSTSPA